MRWVFDHGVALAAFAAATLSSKQAAAGDDPSHGRVDGELSVVAGLGAVVAPGSARGEGEVRLRYLETAGLFATYEDAPWIRSGNEPSRVFVTGLEVRPLFLFRWLQGFETTHTRADLAFDSIGLELGAAFLQTPGTPFASTTGLELGLGVEVPICEGATGPWVGFHGGLRFSDGALGSSRIEGPVDRSAYLAVTLAWHQTVGTHAVDLGDRAPY